MMSLGGDGERPRNALHGVDDFGKFDAQVLDDEVFHAFEVCVRKFDLGRAGFRDRVAVLRRSVKVKGQAFREHGAHLFQGVARGDTARNIG